MCHLVVGETGGGGTASTVGWRYRWGGSEPRAPRGAAAHCDARGGSERRRKAGGARIRPWRPAAGEEGDGPIRLLTGVPANDARRGGRGGLGGAPGLHGGARERPQRRESTTADEARVCSYADERQREDARLREGERGRVGLPHGGLIRCEGSMRWLGQRRRASCLLARGGRRHKERLSKTP